MMSITVCIPSCSCMFRDRGARLCRVLEIRRKVPRGLRGGRIAFGDLAALENVLSLVELVHDRSDDSVSTSITLQERMSFFMVSDHLRYEQGHGQAAADTGEEH